MPRRRARCVEWRGYSITLTTDATQSFDKLQSPRRRMIMGRLQTFRDRKSSDDFKLEAYSMHVKAPASAIHSRRDGIQTRHAGSFRVSPTTSLLHTLDSASSFPVSQIQAQAVFSVTSLQDAKRRLFPYRRRSTRITKVPFLTLSRDVMPATPDSQPYWRSVLRVCSRAWWGGTDWRR